jgi:hypothetical protein
MKRMGSALKFLTHDTQEGDEFLDSTVSGDETWFWRDNVFDLSVLMEKKGWDTVPLYGKA